MSPSPEQPRAILYAAKSTEDKHGSIPTQLEDCRAMAEREGWEVVGEFSDEGFSAYSGNRGPDLEKAKRMAADAADESGTACMLVAQHSDRLARGAGDKPGAADSLVEIWHAMRRRDVHLRSVQNDAMLGDPLLVAAASKLAHEESQRKSETTKAGMKRLAERGKHNGGRAPFGYSFDAEGLEVVPHQAEIVRRIFSEFGAGKSLTQIGRDLQREGVPTARGGKWRTSTVGGILDNPCCIGKIEHNGEILPGTHKAILDEGTWGRAASIRSSRGTRRGRPPKGRHLFKGGMLRCGRCGEAMSPRTREDWEFYYCNGNSSFGKEFCSQGAVGRSAIDTAVYTYFEHVGLDVEATREQLAESRDRKLAEVRALLQDAEHQAQRASESLARVRRDYTRGALGAEDWREFRSELSAEKQAAEAEVERLQEQEAEVLAWGELKDVQADTLRKLADLRRAIGGEIQDAEGIEAVRVALSRMFDRLVLNPKLPPNNSTPIMRAGTIDSIMHIQLILHESMVPGYEEKVGLVLRPETTENKVGNGSPSR